MDRTPFFRTCIGIYEEGLKADSQSSTQQKSRHDEKLHGVNTKQKSQFDMSGTFVQDSISTAKVIDEIVRFLNSVKSEYLLWNSRKMDEEAKDRLDLTLKAQINGLNRKVDTLKRTSTELNKQMYVTSGVSVKEIGLNLASMGKYGQKMQMDLDTVAKMRSNVVKSLGLRLTKLSDLFVSLYATRMQRKNEHDKSYLSTNTEYFGSDTQEINTRNSRIPNGYTSNNGKEDMLFDNSIQQDDNTNTVEYDNLQKTLPTQQLQQLSKENEDLQLQLKDEHLKSVEQMETSAVDISSMINEISLQLNLQNESINTLSGYQDDIMSNMKLGNKQLVKANDRNKNSGRNLSAMIIFMAVLLLIIDYIL